jgi:wyosine [tRNA(Phe)-imidazoG37] synthetase (radical SAM superfamily)
LSGSGGLVFGPVPSRRLGRSLGINNVPAKRCTYSCVYCQVGRTRGRDRAPRDFYAPELLIGAVERRVEELRRRGERVDFLTFVPDGEPTLDRRLGQEIGSLRHLGVPVAVISNGSLAWRREVRTALTEADWVSLKVDAGEETAWWRANRPHASLRLEVILEGLLDFAACFAGELCSETMLVQEVNDSDVSIDSVASFLEKLRPRVAYIAVPTRPGAEPWMRPAGEEAVNYAYQRFAERLPRVELLTGFEGTEFASTGDPLEDLLAITAVHPLRSDAALALMARAGADPSLLDALVREGRIRTVEYQGHRFYVRRHSGFEHGEAPWPDAERGDDARHGA